MKIIDWKLINHALSPGSIVVLQKHISGRKSIFSGCKVVYLGTENNNTAKFDIKRNVSARNSRLGDYVAKMHQLASFPIVTGWTIPNNEWTLINCEDEPNYRFWKETIASETFEEMMWTEWHRDSIHYVIRLHMDSFAFVQENHWDEFIQRHRVDDRIREAWWLDTYFPSATKHWDRNIWSHETGIELGQIMWNSEAYYRNDFWWITVRDAFVIMNFHETRLRIRERRSPIQVSAHPLTYPARTRPGTRLDIGHVQFDTHNNSSIDEAICSLGQLISFTYLQTMPQSYSASTSTPVRFCIGTGECNLREPIEYINQTGDIDILGVPYDSQARSAPRFSYSDSSIQAAAQRMTDNIWERAVYGTSIGGFRATTTTTSSNWGFYQLQVDNSEDMNTSEILRMAQQRNQLSSDEQLDYNQWELVYIKPEFLWMKMHRKNREYVVMGYYGTDNNWTQVFTVQPANKKSINGEWTINIKSNQLFKADKVTKRKFQLAADFGKYKKWQVFTRDEMIQIFGKFQDARDPFILNQLYICAE